MKWKNVRRIMNSSYSYQTHSDIERHTKLLFLHLAPCCQNNCRIIGKCISIWVNNLSTSTIRTFTFMIPCWCRYWSRAFNFYSLLSPRTLQKEKWKLARRYPPHFTRKKKQKNQPKKLNNFNWLKDGPKSYHRKTSATHLTENGNDKSIIQVKIHLI